MPKIAFAAARLFSAVSLVVSLCARSKSLLAMTMTFYPDLR
jgi:hypothetical protein